MALINWPSALPLMVLGDAKLRPGNRLLASPMAAGAAVKVSDSAPHILEGTLILSREQDVVFEGFLQSINGGQDFFLMPVNASDHTADHRVKFILPMAGSTTTGINQVQYRLMIEVYNAVVIDADMLAFLSSYSLADLELAADILQGLVL